ncbi:DUF6049 family protein [Naasia lichenicola]|uniref:2-oxoglutarate dehydrogenase n=1 Tax=Naasia lichenicola TaxID=2565933 RepID=A0A4S4FJP1_9MICO|nr:DUF6049 family protein [Naasia lichenicola]THG29475.1 hypothetical protein E6C64_12310 [Naasia lichenicola]
MRRPSDRRATLSSFGTRFLCRWLVGAMLSGAIAMGILAGGPAAPAIAAGTAPSEPAGSAGAVELLVSASRGAVLRSGSDLVLTGTVSNGTADPLGAGALQVRIDGQLADRSDLAAAIADPESISGVLAATVSTPDVAAGGSTAVDITIPAATVGALLSSAGWGPHLVRATFEVDAAPAGGSDDGTADGVDISTATAVVWADGTAPSTVDTAIVVPVTVAPGQDGVLSADQLSEYTSTEGALSRKLDALATAPNAIIALDPRIIASIRVLGTSAPASSLDWLTRLSNLPNAVFPLQYADADLSLERAAGAAGPLSATSLLWALDSATFGGSDAPAASPTAAPTPGTAPPAGQPIPTLDDLLRWDWTATDIAWPSADSVSTPDLSFLAGAGYSRVVLSSDNMTGGSPTSGSLTAEPVQSLGDTTALVADSGISASLSDAAFAATDAGVQAGLAMASAQLAATAVERPGRASTVLIALDRAAEPAADGLTTALATLRTLPGVADAGAGAISSSATSAAGSLVDSTRAGAEIVAQLLALDARITPYASVVATPELLIGRERTRLLAVLAAGWASDPVTWQAAAEETRSHFDDVLHAVTVLPGSPIIAAGQFETVPIYVRNNLGYPVDVIVDPRPSNGRIIMERYSAAIEPGESQRVFLPAKWIANGTLTIAITLSSASTGLQIDGPTYISLDVQTYWETAVYIVTGVLVLALFGFGIYRNIVRRRRVAASADARASLDAARVTSAPEPGE